MCTCFSLNFITSFPWDLRSFSFSFSRLIEHCKYIDVYYHGYICTIPAYLLQTFLLSFVLFSLHTWSIMLRYNTSVQQKLKTNFFSFSSLDSIADEEAAEVTACSSCDTLVSKPESGSEECELPRYCPFSFCNNNNYNLHATIYWINNPHQKSFIQFGFQHFHWLLSIHNY